MAYKVLVCGSRKYQDRDRVFEVLDAVLAKKGHDILLITGGARGADEYAMDWAASRQVDHLVLYPRWNEHGKAAGPIRNRRMAKKNPKLVLAFAEDVDNTRGTRDMIAVAEKAKIKTKVFH